MIEPETMAYDSFANLVKQWMRDHETKNGMIERANMATTNCQLHIAVGDQTEYYTALSDIIERYQTVLIS